MLSAGRLYFLPVTDAANVSFVALTTARCLSRSDTGHTRRDARSTTQRANATNIHCEKKVSALNDCGLDGANKKTKMVFIVTPMPAIFGLTLSKQPKIIIGAIATASRIKSCESVRK